MSKTIATILIVGPFVGFIWAVTIRLVYNILRYGRLDL